MIQYDIERCPKCDADLDGGMIPIERRALLKADRYSIAIPKLHGVLCPNCRRFIYTAQDHSIQSKEAT